MDYFKFCYSELASGPTLVDGATVGQPGEKNLNFKSEKDQGPRLEPATEKEILRRNPLVLAVEPNEQDEKAGVFQKL